MAAQQSEKEVYDMLKFRIKVVYDMVKVADKLYGEKQKFQVNKKNWITITSMQLYLDKYIIYKIHI